jgi:hypothetical protein
MNFGVSGYSIEQELLLVKEQVSAFSTDTLLLVVYLGNDLLDNQLAFPLQAQNGKPYFRAAPHGLELENSPVPLTRKPGSGRSPTLKRMILGDYRIGGLLSRAARYSEICRVLEQKFSAPASLAEKADFKGRFKDALDLFFAIVGEMKKECARRGIELKLILMPGRSFVLRPGSPSAQYQDYIRKQIAGNGSQLGVPVMDLAGLLRKAAENRDISHWYHPNEGHLTRAGNKEVAGLILEWLKSADGE